MIVINKYNHITVTRDKWTVITLNKGLAQGITVIKTETFRGLMDYHFLFTV
mgnify:CR=1 FL=1